MDHKGPRGHSLSRREVARRVVIWFFIIAVPWVSGAVALAMILTGNVGR